MATCDWRSVMLPKATISATSAPMAAPVMKPSTRLPVVTATAKLPMAERTMLPLTERLMTPARSVERLPDGGHQDGGRRRQHTGQSDD